MTEVMASVNLTHYPLLGLTVGLPTPQLESLRVGLPIHIDFRQLGVGVRLTIIAGESMQEIADTIDVMSGQVLPDITGRIEPNPPVEPKKDGL